MMMDKSRMVGVIISDIVVVVCFLVGCAFSEPSPLGTDGVRRITPRGQAWSHVSGISWSPDGTELALTWMFGGADLIPEGYIYIADVEEGKPRILTQTKADGEFVSPTWSPTANQIAFYSNGWDSGSIRLVDIDGENPPPFLREGASCAWAPDGERIAIGDLMGMIYTIYVLNIHTGEQRQVFQVSEEGKYVVGGDLSWSPVGDRLAFSLGLYDQDRSTPTTIDIHELDLISGESRLLTEGGQNRYPSWSPDGTMIAFSGGESWQEQTLVITRVDDNSTIRPFDVVGIGPVAWSPDGSKIAFEWKGAVYAIDTAVALEEWQTRKD
jgi:Tol biopolymer transport system component